MTYDEAVKTAKERAYQAALANHELALRGGCDFGVWKTLMDWTVMRLPLPEHRAGTELRCEIVRPMVNTQGEVFREPGVKPSKEAE